MYTCKKCGVSKELSEYYKTTDRKSKHKTIAYLDKHRIQGE